LNSKLLIEWAATERFNGNKKILLNPENKIFCKAIVSNGGDDSKLFIENMHLENPKEEYAECINILKESRINVFYKPWDSGETFQDISDFNFALTTEIEEIKKENEEARKEIEYLRQIISNNEFLIVVLTGMSSFIPVCGIVIVAIAFLTS